MRTYDRLACAKARCPRAPTCARWLWYANYGSGGIEDLEPLTMLGIPCRDFDRYLDARAETDDAA